MSLGWAIQLCEQSGDSLTDLFLQRPSARDGMSPLLLLLLLLPLPLN